MRHATLPSPNKKYAREVTLKIGITSLRSIDTSQTVMSCALLMMNFILICLIKPSCQFLSGGTILKHHQYYVVPYSFLGPVNIVAMFTTGNSSWRRRFPQVCTLAVVVNVKNEFPTGSIELVSRSFTHESIILKKLCEQVLLLFHIPRYLITKLNSNPIRRAHKVRNKPLVLTTHIEPRHQRPYPFTCPCENGS